MIRYSITALLIILVAACAQITPQHEIPVKPDYIYAGVQVSDTLEVTTKDGKLHEIEVTDVGTHFIESVNGRIYFSDIQSIVKRSWTAPEHPCGAGEPVGCSIPEVMLVLSDDLNEQADKFHPACVTHDFCYRHGFATYGVNREQCDATFYENMRKACAGSGGLGRLDVKGYSICELAANQTFEAVKKYGEPNYRGANSTYCEYRVEP